jgi:hypothetical protein
MTINTVCILILTFLFLGLTLYWVSTNNNVYHKGETLFVLLKSRSEQGDEAEHWRMRHYPEGVEDRKDVFDDINGIVKELEKTRKEVLVVNVKFI